MTDYLTLTDLEALGLDPADLPPTPQTGLDGRPCWERSALMDLLGSEKD